MKCLLFHLTQPLADLLKTIFYCYLLFYPFIQLYSIKSLCIVKWCLSLLWSGSSYGLYHCRTRPLWPSHCPSVSGSLAALSSHMQPVESWAGQILCFPCLVILYLSVSPRVFRAEETRRQGYCPRGLQSKQMLALGLLENFQINYLSVENGFLTKWACLWNASASHG